MGNCMNDYTCGCTQHRGSNIVSGNSVDIKVTECEVSEVRADVMVQSSGGENCKIIRLWGQIKDCKNKPVPNALLKLVKVICTVGGNQYQGIAHTVSDCEGFYQFDLCYEDGTECYKILVSKTHTGKEQIIDAGVGNCDPCKPNGGYQPCKPYESFVTPATKCCAPSPCPPCPCPPCPCPCPPCYPPCAPYPSQGQCGTQKFC